MIINRKIFFFVVALIMAIGPLFAQTITFTPQWHAQSQFAGYYAALEEGYYKDEGLDVTIKHISKNTTKSLPNELVSGNADIISMTLLQALQARAKGIKLVNVLQLSQNNPNYCIATKPIKSIEDLNGCRIGRWQIGDVQIFDLIFKKYNINVDWIVCADAVNLYLFGAVDAMLGCSYNEYYKLLSSVGKINKDCIVKAYDLGYNYPTDGLYVTESFYKNNGETIKKFIKATIKGWQFAESNEEKTLQYVYKWRNLSHSASSYYRSKMMLRETLSMFRNKESDKMDFAPVKKDIFEKINNELLNINSISCKVPYDDLIKTDLIHENSD